MLLAALSVEKINTAGMIVAAIFVLIVIVFTLITCFKHKGDEGSIIAVGIFVLVAGVHLIQVAMFACAVAMQK